MLTHRQYPFLIPVLWLIALALLLVSIVSCGPKATTIHGNNEGYDLDNPLIIQLPTTLNEISGLYYYPKDSALFAIVDEEGFLYKIPISNPDSIYRWRFFGKGDFEDIILQEGIFYILRSDGDMFVATINDANHIQTIKYDAPDKGNEFEAIYYDDSTQLIMLVCKDCKKDDKDKLSTYAFDPHRRQFVPTEVAVKAVSIGSITGRVDERFKPSAALVNPFTNQLMILSSVNKLLVTTTRSGEVIQAYPLGPKYYKQPEGMAIGLNRTLYISNESAGRGASNILVLPYKQTRN